MIKKNNLNDWPSFDTEEVKLVEEILLTGKVNYWTGSHGKEFEKEFAQWIGSRHSIAVANGTLALDLALKSLDIGPGDKVIVTPRSFIASVSSVINLGAEPIFCDVSRESGNITIDSIESVISFIKLESLPSLKFGTHSIIFIETSTKYLLKIQ